MEMVNAVSSRRVPLRAEIPPTPSAATARMATVAIRHRTTMAAKTPDLPPSTTRPLGYRSTVLRHHQAGQTLRCGHAQCCMTRTLCWVSTRTIDLSCTPCAGHTRHAFSGLCTGRRAVLNETHDPYDSVLAVSTKYMTGLSPFCGVLPS